MDTVDFTPPELLPLLLPAQQWFLHQHVRATRRLKEKAEELKTKLDEINAALVEKQQSSDKITDEPHELNPVRKPPASSDNSGYAACSANDHCLSNLDDNQLVESETQ